MLGLIGSESSEVSTMILNMLSQHFLLLPSSICSAYTTQGMTIAQRFKGNCKSKLNIYMLFAFVPHKHV